MDCCEPGRSEARPAEGENAPSLVRLSETLVFSLEPSGWLALSCGRKNLLQLIGQLFEFPVLVLGHLRKANMRFANHSK